MKSVSLLNRHFLLLVLMAGLAGCLRAQPGDKQETGRIRLESRAILIADAPTGPEVNAANELREHLEKITGGGFPVTRESDHSGDGPVFSVGATRAFASAFPDVNPGSLKPDSIVMKSKDASIYLTGQGSRGALYAVYSFLEDHCGVRWWTSTASRIPQNPELTVDAPDRIYEPVFLSRETYYHDLVMESYGRFGKATPEQERFSVRMKNNGHNAPVSPAWGGKMELLGWAHTFTRNILPFEKYGKSHPEWFSSTHHWEAQLDYANPKMRQEFLKNLRAWLDANPGTKVVSVSMNDSKDSFQSKEIQRIDEEEGSPTGNLLRFINWVAGEIKSSHPGVLLETLAYLKYEEPPRITRPADNVIVRFAPIYSIWSEPLEAGNFEKNREFLDRLKIWKDIADKIYIWDYTVNFTNLVLPHPNLFSLGPNIQTYAKNNVIGVFAQGNAYTPTGELDELKAWLIARMLWDPSRDPDALIAEFLVGYYGPAAPKIRDYIDVIHEAGRTQEITCYDLKAGWIDLATANRATGMLDDAEKLAGDDKEIQLRVRKARLAMDHFWLLNWQRLKNEAVAKNLPFRGPSDPLEGLEAFRSACRELNCTHVAELSMGRASMQEHLQELEVSFTPPTPPLPPPFDSLRQEDVVDLQEGLMRFFGDTKIVADPATSNQRAARSPGKDRGWNIQASRLEKMGAEGRWHCYALIRIEAEEGATGPAVELSVHGNKTLRNAGTAATFEDFANDGYTLVKTGPVNFDGKDHRVLYVAPLNTAKVRSIFVDRMFLVREGAIPAPPATSPGKPREPN